MLCAVFVPVAFVSGLTGQFYRQFGITIAASTLISTFNSLTLSPALAALAAQAQERAAGWFQRGINRVLGGFFGLFNRVFERASERYGRTACGASPPYAGSFWGSSSACWSAPGGFSGSCRAASFRRRTSSI